MAYPAIHYLFELGEGHSGFTKYPAGRGEAPDMRTGVGLACPEEK